MEVDPHQTQNSTTEYESAESGDFARFLEECIDKGHAESSKVRTMTFKLPFDTLEHSGLLDYLKIDPSNLWDNSVLRNIHTPQGHWAIHEYAAMRLHYLLVRYETPQNVPIKEFLEVYEELLRPCTQIRTVVVPRAWAKEIPFNNVGSINTRIQTVSEDRKSVLLGCWVHAPAGFVPSTKGLRN